MFMIGRIPLWVPLFMLLRETLMIVGSWYLLKERDTVVYSDHFGKAATFFYVLAFGLLFWLPDEPRWIRDVIFIIPVLLSLTATINYTYKNRDKWFRRRDAEC
jgi:phosphatidylglycerophosphate synthase